MLAAIQDYNQLNLQSNYACYDFRRAASMASGKNCWGALCTSGEVLPRDLRDESKLAEDIDKMCVPPGFLFGNLWVPNFVLHEMVRNHLHFKCALTVDEVSPSIRVNSLITASVNLHEASVSVQDLRNPSISTCFGYEVRDIRYLNFAVDKTEKNGK